MGDKDVLSSFGTSFATTALTSLQLAGTGTTGMTSVLSTPAVCACQHSDRFQMQRERI
jgi:hypothetical protein